MKKALLLFLLTLSVYFSQAQSVINGAITTSDPTFHRPDQGAPPTTLSDAGTNVYYDVLTVNVTTTGLITFACNGSVNFDTFGILYGSAGFNPANPLSNALVADDDSGPGVNFAITYNFTVPGVYYIVVCPFKNPSTGTYSITSTEGGVLPVRLISFTAEKASGGKNLLKWVSAGESNIDKYQVQHSSNGSAFTDIAGATIDGRNLATNTYYNFTDNNPFEKLNFYRLKIIEKTNLITYSTIAVVNNNKNRSAASITVFPNPTVNYLNIQTKTGQKGKADVIISSANGQIVYRRDYIIASESILNVDVQKLAVGNYFVRIKTPDGEITNLPFIKH